MYCSTGEVTGEQYDDDDDELGVNLRIMWNYASVDQPWWLKKILKG